MENVTITIDKSLTYELEIIIRDRIQTLQSERSVCNDSVVRGIIDRQLERAYALHNVALKTIAKPLFS